MRSKRRASSSSGGFRDLRDFAQVHFAEFGKVGDAFIVGMTIPVQAEKVLNCHVADERGSRMSNSFGWCAHKHDFTYRRAFCSALPVAYSEVAPIHWRGFASLVLEAAYEATLWAAVANARRAGSNTVLLTSLGGGAFGNKDKWIANAMSRALRGVKNFDLDVRLVSFGAPSRAFAELADEFA